MTDFTIRSSLGTSRSWIRLEGVLDLAAQERLRDALSVARRRIGEVHGRLEVVAASPAFVHLAGMAGYDELMPAGGLDATVRRARLRAPRRGAAAARRPLTAPVRAATHPR